METRVKVTLVVRSDSYANAVVILDDLVSTSRGKVFIETIDKVEPKTKR